MSIIARLLVSAVKRLKHLWWKIELASTNFANRGSNVQICRGGFLLAENIAFGDDVYLGPDSFISAYGKVEIESGVVIGPRIKIYTANHLYEGATAIPYDDELAIKPVRIGANSWIGGDVILLPGIAIGEGCIVAAGSVVTKSFPSGSVIGGNPARLLKNRDMETYQRLKGEGRVYMRLKNRGKFEP